MAYRMFSIGLVVLAFVGMSLCQQLQQPNSGLPSQYFPSILSQWSFQGSSAPIQQSQTRFEDIGNQSEKLSSSNLELSRQSQSYQDAVQQQNLAQSYQTPFENTGVQYSIDKPNSYRGNQDSQQYYVPAIQQSAEPQFITKESYSAYLPEVITSLPTTSAHLRPDYKQQFTTPHFDTLAQAQEEYRRQFATLEQAQNEYKQQFAALSQAQQELKQRFAAPVQAQQELKQQSSVLAKAQQEYNQQFSALVQAQKEDKQQFADLAQAQLESKQQFAAFIEAQKELKHQFVAPAQIPHEYIQRFSAPAQQVYRQQYVVPDQGRQDYRQRFSGPTPRYEYIQKSTTASATAPVNYLYVAAIQPKFQYAAIPQQYQQQKYYTVPTGQVTVTEQPRVQQSATDQSSSKVVISTTPTTLKESVVYKSESTPTSHQQLKVTNNNLGIIV